jgi:hypothetical protein
MDILTEDTKLYLRDAAVCLIPVVTDEQVDRIRWEIEQLSPFALVRRLTQNTLLAEGIPVRARSSLDAESRTWELVAARVRRALRAPEDAETRITSIDVRDRSQALV